MAWNNRHDALQSWERRTLRKIDAINHLEGLLSELRNVGDWFSFDAVFLELGSEGFFDVASQGVP
jgi:hypothetical protein